ncbi:MAG: SLC13 family permease [Oscillospiraceae bacterium]
MSTLAQQKQKIDTKYIIKSLIGIAIMIVFRFIPAPEPITRAGMNVLGLFIGLIYLWSAVDMMWPTFVAMVMFGLDAYVIYPDSWQLSGVYEAGQQAFGNWIVIFVIACLLVCYALEKAGTIKRICMAFITSKIARKSPWAFTFMFVLAALVVSLFLDVAPAQLFVLAIAHEIFNILGFKEGDRWPKYMVICITYSAVLGFAMTPICHTLPILWMSIYSAITGVPSNILTYVAIAAPVGLIIWLIMMLWMKKVIKMSDNVKELENIDWAKIEAMKPGKMDLREKIVVTASVLLIACWIIPSILSLFAADSALYAFVSKLGDSSFLFLIVALLAIIKVDGEPLLNLKEAFGKISWLPVVLLAGIMMVASAMGEESSGIPAWISTYVVPLVSGMSPYAMVALIAVLCVVLTNVANNVPVGIIFVSAGVPMCLELGINPLPLALAVCVSANLAYTIPPAYVPVGIAYADPYCEGRTVLKNGIFMCIVSAIICGLLIYPLGVLFS